MTPVDASPNKLLAYPELCHGMRPKICFLCHGGYGCKCCATHVWSLACALGFFFFFVRAQASFSHCAPLTPGRWREEDKPDFLEQTAPSAVAHPWCLPFFHDRLRRPHASTLSKVPTNGWQEVEHFRRHH